MAAGQALKFFSSGCRRSVLLLAVLGLSFSAAATTVYRSEDASGHISFTDKPALDAQPLQVLTAPQRYRVQLKRVIDGDTLVLDDDRRVRLLGINTPEIANRHHAAEPGGDAARQWLVDKLADAVLYIEYDQQQLDQYGRLLAYCYLPDGELLNLSLLELGHAMLTIVPPNSRYSEQFSAAQAAAQQAQRGIWALPEYQLQTLDILSQQPPPRGWQRLHVRPQRVSISRNALLLQVSDNFRLRIADEHQPLFAEPQQYLNRDWQVQGWLTRRGEQFTMQLRHPSAITPLSPAGADTAAAAGDNFQHHRNQ